MAVDALDPGPNGDYPYASRPGTPGTRMPDGKVWQRTPDGRLVLVDVTPRTRDGRPLPVPGVEGP